MVTRGAATVDHRPVAGVTNPFFRATEKGEMLPLPCKNFSLETFSIVIVAWAKSERSDTARSQSSLSNGV
jgi:hypothetical protein